MISSLSNLDFHLPKPKIHMKHTTKTLLTLSALAGLSFTAAQAATITWDDGGANEDWTTLEN